jgi:hypothetical protein
VDRFLGWLKQAHRQQVAPQQMNRQFTVVRLKFNAVLDQLDIFTDVISQRGEQRHGIWVAGLDHAALDALATPKTGCASPPLICYLERGHGAAIRRVHTRLPGGAKNPVSIIRVPRERMIGIGIAGSLYHEVGHQGAALLGLVNSLGDDLRLHSTGEPIWEQWWRWRSEVIADLWALAQLGVAATLGLMGVVSLPKAFVFRLNRSDAHPTPWLRVILSTRLGEVLFPDPQWARLRARWKSYYPVGELPRETRDHLGSLEDSLQDLVPRLLNHQLPGGKALLGEIFPVRERQPASLRSRAQRWLAQPRRLYAQSPGLAFAVLGQARADGRLSPQAEANHLETLLTHWAHQKFVQATK